MRCRPVLGVPRGCTIVAIDPKRSREENMAAAEGVAGSFLGWSVLAPSALCLNAMHCSRYK
jgi:hypothetical protein